MISFGDPIHEDKVTAFVKRHAEQWVDLHGEPVEDARASVEALELDVLVYVEVGIDIIPYLLAFMRLSRIQVITLTLTLTLTLIGYR